ncbi:NADH dehydrogenase subunit 1 (mitochondrion) [Fragariocoptes setiger]|uniref:NADH-ubiquinone oxidoreductase chain 1 n=1 Tax=Fragariocoptes setiger TaxID=1670756 RepID=A0ABQ7SDG5_9ACAR|nr:NADH dehydrogenase subunit 1 [Fragariocoptes setiger]
MMILTVKTFLNLLPILLSVAFITLMERKILGLTMMRLSPQKISMAGILQPMSDAVKLSNKESNIMTNSSMILFSMISTMFLTSSLIIWNTNMTNPQVLSIKNNILFIITVLSLNSSMIIYMGWSSYSKYSLMGAIRCAAQTISYEAVLMMILVTFIWSMKSFSSQMSQTCKTNIMLILPLGLMMWLPTSLAEMNRTPYDFSESESELVSGFNTEFGSKEFSMIFIAEYSNIIFMMMISSYIFTSMNSMFLFMMTWVLWIRSTLPRLRFDKLMMMAWKSLIPLSTMFLILTIIMI